MKYDKEMTVDELDDAIKANKTQIKKDIRKLGAEKITCYLLKNADLSVVPDFHNIRQEVLDTYADDKQPDFMADLAEKAEKRVRKLISNIESLEKLTNVLEEKADTLRTTLDTFKQDTGVVE